MAKRDRIFLGSGITARKIPLTKLNGCPICNQVVAPGASDKMTIEDQDYHKDCLKSPGFGKNGTQNVFKDLTSYHQGLLAKKDRTYDEIIELKELDDIFKK